MPPTHKTLPPFKRSVMHCVGLFLYRLMNVYMVRVYPVYSLTVRSVTATVSHWVLTGVTRNVAPLEGYVVLYFVRPQFGGKLFFIPHTRHKGPPCRKAREGTLVSLAFYFLSLITVCAVCKS